MIVIFGNPAAGHKMYYVSKSRVDTRIWYNDDVTVTFDKEGLDRILKADDELQIFAVIGGG